MDGYDVADHKLAELVVSQRGSWWARQSIEAQRECWARARVHHVNRNAELRKGHEELCQQLEDLLAKDKKESEVHPPVCMSVAALEEFDLEKMETLIESKEFCAPKRIGLLRASITSAPLPESLPALPAGTEVWCRREPQQPAWASVVAEHREFFSDCVLVFCDGGVTKYYKFVYGAQKPNTYLAICELHPIANYTASPLPAAPTAKQLISSSFDIAFKCNYADMATAADLPPLELTQLSVMFGLKHRGGTVVTAVGSPVPLQRFLHGGPTPKESMPAPAKDLVVDKEFESLVLDMPWLEHLTLSDSFVAGVKKASARQEPSGSTAKLVEFECEEDEIFAALDKIEKARAAEGCIATARGHIDFKCSGNYGESNLKKVPISTMRSKEFAATRSPTAGPETTTSGLLSKRLFESTPKSTAAF